MKKAPKSRDGYHHGDLRAAVLNAAVELIAEHGVAKLSLRECARRAGVSHAAPYRHFPSKDSLLVAIAEEGFAGLAQAGRTAMEGLDDPRARLDGYGVAYVRFAIEHPVHMRVMFTLQLDESLASQIDNEAFDLLVQASTAVTGPDADPMHAAVATWSLVHGLSMLILDGRIPEEFAADAAASEQLARTTFAMWRGPLAR